MFDRCSIRCSGGLTGTGGGLARGLEQHPTMSRLLKSALITIGLTAVAACGGIDPELESSSQALQEFGFSAALVSEDVPPAMEPLERRTVNVVLTNTGDQSPDNDWHADDMVLLSRTVPRSRMGFTLVRLPHDVAVGEDVALSFVITAPRAEGIEFVTVRMHRLDEGDFGPTLVLGPIEVTRKATPVLGYELLSFDGPRDLEPGERAPVTVTVRNRGSATWPANEIRLYSMSTPRSLWGVVHVGVDHDVRPGEEATFELDITAPAAAGSYPLRFRLYQIGGLGLFGSELGHTVDVAAAAPTECPVPPPADARGVYRGDVQTTSCYGECSWSCQQSTRPFMFFLEQDNGRWIADLPGYQMSQPITAAYPTQLRDGLVDCGWYGPSGTRTLAFTSVGAVHYASYCADGWPDACGRPTNATETYDGDLTRVCVPDETVCIDGRIVTCDHGGNVTADVACGAPCAAL